MEKKSIYFLIFTFFVFIHTQAQWHWENPLPQGNNLNELFFVDTIGYAVGDYGAILKSFDKGANWLELDSLTVSDLNSVYFADENTGYIVGDNGTILKTNDGDEWEHQESGIHYRFNSVCFINPDEGYIGGYKGTILKTTDGGNNWEILNAGTLKSIYSICFTSANTGFIVGDSGLIMKTIDAGLNWIQYDSETYAPLYDICFPTEDIGVITGENSKIFRTDDAGEFWLDVSYPAFEIAINSVHFLNMDFGYAVGNQGAFFWTGNSGATWEFQLTNTHLDLKSVFVLNDDLLYDTLIACGQNGLIIISDSCGGDGTWENSTPGSSLSFSSVLFTNESVGWTVGGDPFLDLPIISNKINSESAWETIIVDTINHFLTDICFLDTLGYISGKGGSIYRTTNSGSDWIPLISGTIETLYSICFLDTSMGYAAGANGTIIKTIAGDTVWTELTTGIAENLYSLFFIDSITGGYAVGENGTVLKIEDYGNHITKINSGIGTPLFDIFFPTDTAGFIVGFNGKIFKIKTVNGTDTLISIPSGVTTPLNNVFFPSVDTGYIAGDGGIVLKTTDAGKTWYPQYTGTSSNLRGVYFSNSNIGYVVGSGVTILKTENGGGEVILPGIDEIIVPENNISVYPNPCSNFTTVEYELFNKSKVQFSLFDLSGKQVKVLLNANQSEGNYKINVNTSGIPDGIYLIVAQINNQLLSEKIIVINP